MYDTDNKEIKRCEVKSTLVGLTLSSQGREQMPGSLTMLLYTNIISFGCHNKTALSLLVISEMDMLPGRRVGFH